MEIAGMLRELWRRRLLVALGAVVAGALGALLVVNAGAATSRVGVASQMFMLDTASSQLVHPAPPQALNLGWRSALAGYSLGTRGSERAIASELGIRPHELMISVPRIETPAAPTPLPTRAAEVAAAQPEPYVLSVGLHLTLPVITLSARAPDRVSARRLVSAGADLLRSLPAAATGAPVSVVEPVSPVRGRVLATRPRRALGVAAAVICFALWCAAVLIVPAVSRSLRSDRAVPSPLVQR